MYTFHAVCDIDSFYWRNEFAARPPIASFLMLNSLSFEVPVFLFAFRFLFVVQQHILTTLLSLLLLCEKFTLHLSSSQHPRHSLSKKKKFASFLRLFVASQFARKANTKKKKGNFLVSFLFFVWRQCDCEREILFVRLFVSRRRRKTCSQKMKSFGAASHVHTLKF